ncbi:MAG: hypothetical protein U9R75_00340, partial [Candidatus Thermoplasmatota archaeon]|nr:hypothetical protein [Candidatus Thermoplasmatota archaeon]
YSHKEGRALAGGASSHGSWNRPFFRMEIHNAPLLIEKHCKIYCGELPCDQEMETNKVRIQAWNSEYQE